MYSICELRLKQRVSEVNSRSVTEPHGFGTVGIDMKLAISPAITPTMLGS